MADEKYTSAYSGTQIDEAVYFGNFAEKIVKDIITVSISKSSWKSTSSTPKYSYSYTLSNAKESFYRPLVFLADEEGNRIDVDYKIADDTSGNKTVTISSNIDIPATMIISV